MVSEEKTFEDFPYMSLCKISDPWGGASFGPRATICTILEEVHKIKIYTKYLVSDKKNFNILPKGELSFPLKSSRSTEGYNFFKLY